MDIRLLTWTTSVITGLLITGTGVHFFRCQTVATSLKYGDDSFLTYFCPVPTNDFDINLAVPVASQEAAGEGGDTRTSWGSPNLSNMNPNATVRLRQHSVFPDMVTVSGFSSGGTMAQHMQIAHSALFFGAATFSHAYYRCGPGTASEAEYDDACTIIGANRTYDPELALADIREYERQGLIDDTRNLRNKRLYVYAGARSGFFDLDLSLAVIRVFEPLIRNPCAIKTRVQDAHQVMPTKSFGGPCQDSAENNYFLANCGFSGAYEALQFLLGDVIRSPPDGVRPHPLGLMSFDQSEFFYGLDEGTQHLMDTIGYIYVPRQCYFRTCFLHFYFHGCLSGRNFNGTGPNHFLNSGYLELAEVNDLIVVAPQAVGNEQNQIECWDSYALTGPQYATKRGAQVRIVRNILARILGEDNRIQNPASPVGQGSMVSSLFNNKISRGKQSSGGGYRY